MDQTHKLYLINEEPNPQQRLKLLVDHGFMAEATQLIEDAVHEHTTFFHLDWNYPGGVCHPLARARNTDLRHGLFVVCHSENSFERNLHSRKADHWEVAFELGWQEETLGWSRSQTQRLVTEVLSQTIVRPLNHWSDWQAEGSVWASQAILAPDDPLAREITALYLVYHLRQADFGHTHNYLTHLKQYPFKEKFPSTPAMMTWMVDHLEELGWTHAQIRKELLEWIRLKTGTWPQWLLAVAKTKVFDENDPARAVAVRHYLRDKLEGFLWITPQRDDQRELTETYRQLFELGSFSTAATRAIQKKVVERLLQGKAKETEWFIKNFGTQLQLDELAEIIAITRDKAWETKQYGVLAALCQRYGGDPYPELDEIVELRQLSTKLK